MRKLKLLPVLLIAILTGCTVRIPGVSDVIEEPAGQKFNTLGKHIKYEIVTSSGEKLDAAVIATIEIGGSDKKVENEARNAARPADREVYDDFLDEHAEKEMKWIKSTVRIYPWNGSDFSNGDALLTCFAGIDSGTEERPFSSNTYENNSLMTSISQFGTYIYDSGDAIMSASLFNFKNESGTPYYEGIVYTIMSVDTESFVFGLTSKKFGVLESRVPGTLPAEGYLCWKIPEKKAEE